MTKFNERIGYFWIQLRIQPFDMYFGRVHFEEVLGTIETWRDRKMKRLEESTYGKKAGELFAEGYNCAQSVFLAFSDFYEIDQETAARLSSSFGGGMGRLREVCGAVSGMFMAAGCIFGYDSPKDYEAKKDHYARIQALAEEFRECHGTIVCRELLGLDHKKDKPVPEKRTGEYYKKRPCREMVETAACILEDYLEKNKTEG